TVDRRVRRGRPHIRGPHLPRRRGRPPRRHHLLPLRRLARHRAAAAHRAPGPAQPGRARRPARVLPGPTHGRLLAARPRRAAGRHPRLRPADPIRPHRHLQELTMTRPTRPADPVIEISHLRKTYGEKVAVADVSLTVSRGEIFGILGPNG